MVSDFWNIQRVQPDPVNAHGGIGVIKVARLHSGLPDSTGCRFVDYSSIPPGCSVGLHTHATNEEEFYFILTGHGRMTRNGEQFEVIGGDLIRNPPGGTHSLENTGDADLQMLVFENVFNHVG